MCLGEQATYSIRANLIRLVYTEVLVKMAKGIFEKFSKGRSTNELKCHKLGKVIN